MAKATLHLSIPVSDIAASVTFYQDLLGCRVTRVIAEVARVTEQNGEAADGLLVSADTLRAQSATLKNEVSTFLMQIRAA